MVNVDLRGTVSNRYGVGATVRVESALGNQVRQLELSRGYMSSSEPMLHFGLGADTVIRRMVVTWPSGHVQAFENLPVDRRYTVTEPSAPIPLPADAPPSPTRFSEVSRSAGLSLLSREEPVDETSVQRLLPFRENPHGPGLAVGDIFGNGLDDVVVGGTTRDSLRILHASASGPYIAADASAVPTGTLVDDGPVLLFDSAGTGRQDLLVTKGGNSLPAGAPEYQPRLFLNDGHGGFRPAPDDALPQMSVSAGAVAAADFDHSGRLGLFIGGRVLPGQYPLAPQSALLANRGGRFEDVTDALAPGLREVGMVTSALWTDVDGDGWPDLLLALEWGTRQVFPQQPGQGLRGLVREGRLRRRRHADGGPRSPPPTSMATAGSTTSSAMSASTRTTTRTPRTPRCSSPATSRAAAGRSSSRDTTRGTRSIPWRSRRDFGAVIPAILKRFPTYDSYARATLAEIVGDEKLAKARRFAATELRSGVFLSQPDGTYRFEPLPRVAQISPLQGMAAGDFGGDGRAGVYAVQNSFAPITSVGRFDGGLSQLLGGDGRGHFAAVPPAASGLVVTGDAKALAVLDLDQDGWPDFLVTRNNDTTLAFRNNGADGQRPLRIRLRGGAGNPTAVGARITVDFADGSSQTSEVYAGSGYYSQSTAACFFGYPQANPPTRIRVRWPSGLSSEHAFPAGSTTLTLSPP